LLSAELRLLGGELGLERAEGGALKGFAADAAYYAVGIAPTPEAKAAVEETLDRVFSVLEPHISSTVYPNFTERPSRPEALFGAAWARLVEVKSTWDPRNVIRSNHPVLS